MVKSLASNQTTGQWKSQKLRDHVPCFFHVINLSHQPNNNFYWVYLQNQCQIFPPLPELHWFYFCSSLSIELAIPTFTIPNPFSTESAKINFSNHKADPIILLLQMLPIVLRINSTHSAQHCHTHCEYVNSHLILTNTINSTIIISIFQRANWGTERLMCPKITQLRSGRTMTWT